MRPWRPKTGRRPGWSTDCCACPSASKQWKICGGIWPRHCNARAADTAGSGRLQEGGTLMSHRSWMKDAAAIALLLGLAMLAGAAQPPAPAAGASSAWTTAQDHPDMPQQLGITRRRPGRNANAGAPNEANYDEALANPYPQLPDVLRLENGRKVTSARQWRRQRRPEIVELFEREVVGRVPKSVPRVSWSVTETSSGEMASHPVNARRLTGKVDNSAHPAIEVNIELMLVTPADAKGPVPVMIMFGRGRMPGEAPPAGARQPPPPRPGADPPATEQLIAAGWGYAYLNPTSVQPDNGAGLTLGIIGLTNKGAPRKP